jgi:hypothetical protein
MTLPNSRSSSRSSMNWAMVARKLSPAGAPTAAARAGDHPALASFANGIR